MHRLSSTLLGLAALFGAATSAFAGAGSITTTVTPLQTNVTYSTSAQMIYVGYRVAIGNTDGNTINHIRFTASASVTDPAELATFDSVEGATCVTTNAARTAIECLIGQLQSGVSYPTFAVFFKAPAKIVNVPPVADNDGQDVVTLSGAMVYAEGPNGTNPAPNSVVPWDSVFVQLGTASDTDVKSGVPKAGGTFSTGIAGVSSGGDRFTTSVTVPGAAVFSTAEIIESEFAICTNFNKCWQSDITIEGNVTNSYSPYLTIVLRQDALNIKPGTKIASVLVRYYYQHPSDVQPLPPNEPVLRSSNVGDCADETTPLGPNEDGLLLPCIAKRVYYKNKSTLDWTPALDGDFEWRIISKKNGRLAID